MKALLPILLLLTSCATNVATTAQSANAFQITSIGGWKIHNCEAQKHSQGATLITSSNFSDDTIYLKLVTPQPLTEAPKIVITSMPQVYISAHGKSRHWGFELPYYPLTVKNYQHANSFLAISATYAIDSQPTQLIFSTQHLPKTIAHLASTCTQ